MFERSPPDQYTANGARRNGPSRERRPDASGIVFNMAVFLDNPVRIAYILRVHAIPADRPRQPGCRFSFGPISANLAVLADATSWAAVTGPGAACQDR